MFPFHLRWESLFFPFPFGRRDQKFWLQYPPMSPSGWCCIEVVGSTKKWAIRKSIGDTERASRRSRPRRNTKRKENKAKTRAEVIVHGGEWTRHLVLKLNPALFKVFVVLNLNSNHVSCYLMLPAFVTFHHLLLGSLLVLIMRFPGFVDT